MIVAELEPVVASRKSNTLRENFDHFGEDFSDGRLTEPYMKEFVRQNDISVCMKQLPIQTVWDVRLQSRK